MGTSPFTDTEFFSDDWSSKPTELAIIVSDDNLDGQGYCKSGGYDSTDYPKLLSKIILSLLEHGYNSGLSIIALGKDKTCPEGLRNHSGLSYRYVKDLEKNRLSSFARDAVLFHTSGDSLVVPGQMKNARLKPFDGILAYEDDVLVGGQTLIAKSRSNEWMILYGSFQNTSELSNDIIEKDFRVTTSKSYGKVGFVEIPQELSQISLLQTFSKFNSVNILKYEWLYNQFDRFYYHLDTHAITFSKWRGRYKRYGFCL